MATKKNEPFRAAFDAATAYAAANDCDVMLFNTQFHPSMDSEFVAELDGRVRKKNILLIMVSEGGNPDAAYKISRALQKRYERVSALVHGYCKSAGTLCVLGAHEVVMSDEGELGPLDVQVAKKDELGERNSGLVTSEALRSLKDQAFEMYEDFFIRILARSQNMVTFRTASDIALRMSVGLLEPLFAQVSPFQVAEMARSMRIAQDYGRRLGAHGGNLKDDALELLCDTYPSHGFVIDREEATQLFKNLRRPTPEECKIVEGLKSLADTPASSKSLMLFLNVLPRSEDEQAQTTTAGAPSSATDQPSTAAGAGGPASTPARRKRVPKPAGAAAG